MSEIRDQTADLRPLTFDLDSRTGFDGWTYWRRILLLDYPELSQREFEESLPEGNA